jgi:hypothetical protein
MRLLFSVNHPGFLRNFEPALRELAARGHDIHLLAERHDNWGGTRTIDNLVREHPERVTFSYGKSRKEERWPPLATQVRLCLDYWRYLDPLYDESPTLRGRAAQLAPRLASRIPGVRSRGVRRLLQRLFTAIERAMPPGATVEGVLRDANPDLLLVTPLLYFGSQQVEYVRAAKAMGIPTVLGVGSWDHLTTKGLIHEIPDRIVVWNDFQRKEATELHGVPPSRISVTGAQAYDHWFVQRPATDRAAFCAKVGVPADRPIILYLCSSQFITPYEVGFVTRWIEAIRHAADPAVRQAAILIRPHPQNAGQWSDFDPARYEAVGIWPRAGANPVDTNARADFYDSMCHSVAMVGINTSAQIESGIVGRPVFTVLTQEFASQQEGTLHFRHLQHANGGLLHVAATLDEHVAQIAPAVRGEHSPAKSRAFVEAFVRPHGLDMLARAQAARRRARAHEAEPAANAPRRLLMVLNSPEYLRYYDTTMRLLADRGHQVTVAVNWLQERKQARLDLIGDDRIITLGAIPERGDMWVPFARAVRGTMDFARYLHPKYVEATALRARMFRKYLPSFVRPLNRIRVLSQPALARLMRLLQSLERAIPVSRAIRAFIESHRPDAVIVSPLVDAASDQVDVVRAAQAAGIPAVAAIASWDNLTNKGLLRVVPDLVTVWNQHQKNEAVEFHGVPPEHVAVTGAQLFDRWFDRRPSRSRDAFGEMVGLQDSRPYVLWVGSSVFIARSEFEVPFVRRWLDSLRHSANARLRDVPVLIRPHPFNVDAWAAADFSDLGPVAIWPRQRHTPAEESSRNSFFDSLYYSAAIVGLNTSAMIEAAILRKPVLSLVPPEFAGTQEGTLHFRYLLPENGGFVRVAPTFDEHQKQLSDALERPHAVREQTEHFVGVFLRPRGLDTACTPALADAFERAASARTLPRRSSFRARLLRVIVAPLAMWLYFADTREAKRSKKVRRVDTWTRVGHGLKDARKAIVRPWLSGSFAVRSVAHKGVRRVVKGARSGRRNVVRWTRLARYNIATRVLGRGASSGDMHS